LIVQVFKHVVVNEVASHCLAFEIANTEF
jgi:hypothetical protein